MRVLIWSPNYWPETLGIPPLVTDAGEWLSARGHEVEVVTAVPNYPERRIAQRYRGVLWRSEVVRGVTVHRSWLRVRPAESFLDKLAYEGTFAAVSLPRVLRRLATTDVVVCVVPSLLAAVCASIFMRATKSIRPSVRFVLWVQDLVVNAATMLHDAPRTSLVLRGARAMELFAARAADAVVVCSPGFADYFASGGLPRRRLVTVNNWVDVERIPATPAPNGHRATRFLYAGNVGYSQGFETLVEAARLRGGAAEVLIVGEGNEAGRVRELAEHLPNLTMRPPVPIEDFPALLASADAHIVLQRRAAAGVNLPSKIGPYLASGRPIVASLDLSTPAAELLRRSGGAVLVPPEDPHMLADAMQTLGRRPDIRRALARSGRAFAERELDRKHALTRLEAVVLG